MVNEKTQYRGHKAPDTAGGCFVSVLVPGKPSRPLPPRFDLRNHSPDGFQWGYEGSGPAQLALAMLAHATDDEFAQAHYQDFKRKVVANLPNEWALDAWTIRERTGYAPAGVH